MNNPTLTEAEREEGLPRLVERYRQEMRGLMLVGESCADDDFDGIEDRYETVAEMVDSGNEALCG